MEESTDVPRIPPFLAIRHANIPGGRDFGIDHGLH
jgi:hypothetical protein